MLTGNIVVEKYIEKKVILETYNTSDFETEISSSTSASPSPQPNIDIYKFPNTTSSNSINILSDEYNPPATPAGYKFETSAYSSYYDAYGYLFSKAQGTVARYEGKRFQFTSGTAVSLIIALVGAYLFKDLLTIDVFLRAVGVGVVGGYIGGYINSNVIFVDTKTLYKGFCRKVETLNTYKIFKNEEITDNKSGNKTLINLGFKSGYNGSMVALANGAIVNYFN